MLTVQQVNEALARDYPGVKVRFPNGHADFFYGDTHILEDENGLGKTYRLTDDGVLMFNDAYLDSLKDDLYREYGFQRHLEQGGTYETFSCP